jgi:nitrilase
MRIRRRRPRAERELRLRPDGRLAARYDKMHLFRYDNGRERYDEGACCRQATRRWRVDIDGWRTGLSVCYDLRFPELYRALSLPPGERRAISSPCPSAFTSTTAARIGSCCCAQRAVENQCYVIAAAQGGVHETGAALGPQHVRGPVGRGDRRAARRRGRGGGRHGARAPRGPCAAQLPALQHRRCR